jgi:hypothetical protein
MRYLIHHWRGQFGLLHAFLINTVLIYVALVFCLLWLGRITALPVLLGIAIFFIWFVWALVGTARSSLHAIANWRTNRAAALSAIVLLLLLAGVVYLVWLDVVFLAQDILSANYGLPRPLFAPAGRNILVPWQWTTGLAS